MPETDEKTTMPLTFGRNLWAVERDLIPRLLSAEMTRRAFGQIRSTAADAKPRAARRSAGQHSGGAVAVIPLTGIITPRGSWIDMIFGGGSGGLIGFRDNFREALHSPDIQAIVLDVDSPGGLVDLVPETAQEIYEARGAKPIIAVANTMAASAAYFIASQADELVATPSGSVGSIGVYMLHTDWSSWNEKFGVAFTYVYAGEHKVDGNPDEPLGDDVKADWQQEVEDLYAMFVNAVALGRGVSADQVRSEYGQGRTLLADRALEAGMVDRVETLETVIGELLIPGQDGRAAAARIGRLALTASTALASDKPERANDDPAEGDPSSTEPTAADRAAFVELHLG